MVVCGERGRGLWQYVCGGGVVKQHTTRARGIHLEIQGYFADRYCSGGRLGIGYAVQEQKERPGRLPGDFQIHLSNGSIEERIQDAEGGF